MMEEGEIEVMIHRDFSSLDIIRASMGRWHHHFARSVKDYGGVVLDLIFRGRAVGQSVIYTVDLGYSVLGVIYYIAILPEYRGKGLGKILLASAEEVLSDMRSENLLATISGDNEASLKLFGEMGYQLYSWDQISDRCGKGVAEVIRMVTCGYEDDIVALKSVFGDPVFPKICNINGGVAKRWWRSACLKPWLDLRGKI
ncbi:MAG: GNAT family N-acetyltransferase [Sulfolobales archaeon]